MFSHIMAGCVHFSLWRALAFGMQCTFFAVPEAYNADIGSQCETLEQSASYPPKYATTVLYSFVFRAILVQKAERIEVQSA